MARRSAWNQWDRWRKMSDAVMTVDAMEQRLQAWAAWKQGGGVSSGYPTKSVLHESWCPPTGGQRPAMRVAVAGGDRRERAIDRAVVGLSIRLQDTLVVVYLMRAKPGEQVARLGCQASTVRARVVEAKRLLALALDQAA
jgi:DNA-directed RNA polymerase specialized sigma24 family protein